MSDRDKGLHAAVNEIPLAAYAFCVERLSLNLLRNFSMSSRSIFNSSIRFALTEERLQAGFTELEGVCLTIYDNGNWPCGLHHDFREGGVCV